MLCKPYLSEARARSQNRLYLEKCPPWELVHATVSLVYLGGILGSVTENSTFFFFLKCREGGVKCWKLTQKCICRCVKSFFMVHSFMQAWDECGDVQMFYLEHFHCNSWVCVSWFFMFFCFFLKMSEELEIQFLWFFFFTIYSFRQGCSSSSSFLYCPHYFFFFNALCLVFDSGPFWSCFILRSSYSVLADSRI